MDKIDSFKVVIMSKDIRQKWAKVTKLTQKTDKIEQNPVKIEKI